jgi:hypothetical protein
MNMTFNLNQSHVNFNTVAAAAKANNYIGTTVNVNVPSGGTSCIMVASLHANNGANAGIILSTAGAAAGINTDISLGVGSRPFFNQHPGVVQGSIGNVVELHVPLYTFNEAYELSYLSNPIKKIVYTDIYQFKIENISPNSQINNLVTNGISNLKSCLIVPYYTSAANAGLNPMQSPFDSAPSTTSPFCHLLNFNVVVAGQNMFNNMQSYTYEAFIHNLSSANSINGNLTDGLTSGLISKLDFEHAYCYYYVDISRDLPLDQNVPKSVSIQGQNASTKSVDYYVFLEYETQIDVDVLSGARVG